MTTIVDGYKLWVVYDTLGVPHTLAGVCAIDVQERAALRGIQTNQNSIGWHPHYGEYAATQDYFDRQNLSTQIASAIYNDVAEFP